MTTDTTTHAGTLRQAAQLMRAKAEAATYVPGRWAVDVAGPVANTSWLGRSHDVLTGTWKQASHVAAWSPAVALAVADWLDLEASMVEKRGDNSPEGHTFHALAVARAYIEAVTR